MVVMTACSPRTLEPVLVGKWDGDGIKNTETIAISGSQWAVSWTFTPDSPILGVYANYFAIEVYQAGDVFPVALIGNIANVNSGRADISYIHESGNFYLSVTSMSGSWAVKVYDYR
jgi:hypothetical protein